MAEEIFTEHVHFTVPEGWRAAIHDQARQDGQKASEWLRSAIRERLREDADGHP